MNHIGLFEGIGGFSLAARWMGWETIAWCEWNPFCQKVLNYHFPKAKQHGDITTTDFTIYRGQCDILTGGFPCQPYSVAGKRLGKEDERHPWPHMLRAIREIKPYWVVGENVSGLINWNGGMVFDEVQTDLENEGYEVIPFVLPACGVDAPHKRDRVWFIAYSHEKFKPFTVQPKNTTVKNIWEWEKEVWRSDWLKPEMASNIYSFLIQRVDRPSFAGINDGVSSELDLQCIKGILIESAGMYGNAIVPQVALQIFKAIKEFNQQHP